MKNPLSYFSTFFKKKSIGALKDDNAIFRSLRSLLEGSSSSRTVTNPYDKSVWVYSSIKAISQNLSRVPYILYENSDKKDPLKREAVTKGKLYDLVQNPNPFMTFRGLIEATSIFLENYGECFWVMEGRKSVTDLPEEIWVLNPQRFSPVYNEEKTKVMGWALDKTASNKGVIFENHEILFFRYFNPYDTIRGLSPISAAQLSVDQDYFSSEYNKNFFKEGAILSGLVTIDEELTPEAHSRLLRQLEDRHSGSNKAHKIALLEGGAKWHNMSANQNDLDFKNLKRLNKEEILAAFRTNPVVLGDYESMKSYEGVRAAHKAFWMESLVPKIKYIEEIVNKNFIGKLSGGRLYGEFDLNSVEALRDDFNYKVQTAWMLHRMNFPVNMINDRLDLGMSPVAWGDTSFVSANNFPAESVLNQKPKKDEDATEDKDDKEDESEDKAIKKQNTGIFSKFNKIHGIIERKFQSKLSRFLFEQRKAVIETLYAVSEDFKVMTSSSIIDKLFPVKENERLKTILKPLYMISVKSGAEMIAEELDKVDFIFKEVDFEYTINSRLNVIPNDIVNIVKVHLSQTLNEGIDSGDSVDELVERIKRVYNFAGSRSKDIAKIESLRAIGDGRFTMMKKSGIDSHKWVSNCQLHKELHNKKVKIDDDFDDTGLKYPGSNSDSLNCTCLSVPINE